MIQTIITALTGLSTVLMGLYTAWKKWINDKLTVLKPAILEYCEKAEKTVTIAESGLSLGATKLKWVLVQLEKYGVKGTLRKLVMLYIDTDLFPATKTNINTVCKQFIDLTNSDTTTENPATGV